MNHLALLAALLLIWGVYMLVKFVREFRTAQKQLRRDLATYALAKALAEPPMSESEQMHWHQQKWAGD